MKKGYTVVFLIFIYFLIYTNVYALEEEEFSSIYSEQSDIVEEIKNDSDDDFLLEEEKQYLVSIEAEEINGDAEENSLEVDDEVFEHSISGEEFEIEYDIYDRYEALNFYTYNNDEKQNTVYSVFVDDEKIYESLEEEQIKNEVKLNIDGEKVKLCLKGNGSYLNPYFLETKNTYEIKYDDNYSITTEESNYIIDDNVEKDGYNFQYYVSNNKKYYPNDEIYLNSDLYLESVYEQVTYSVTYNYLDISTTMNYTITDNNLFVPEIDGYRFLGWYDLSGNRVDKLTTGNISLFAKLKKNTQAVNYLNYSNNIVYTEKSVSDNSNINDKIEKKEDIVSVESVDTPFNSKGIKINYFTIFGVLFLLISVLLVVRFSLDS